MQHYSLFDIVNTAKSAGAQVPQGKYLVLNINEDRGLVAVMNKSGKVSWFDCDLFVRPSKWAIASPKNYLALLDSMPALRSRIIYKLERDEWKNVPDGYKEFILSHYKQGTVVVSSGCDSGSEANVKALEERVKNLEDKITTLLETVNKFVNGQ